MTLLEELQDRRQTGSCQPLTVQGVRAGAISYLLAHVFHEHSTSLWIVTPDATQRDVLYDDLRCFLAERETSPASPAKSTEVVYRYVPRPPASAAAIASLQQQALEAYQPLWRLRTGDPVVVVTAVDSLRYRVVPPHQLAQTLLSVHVGLSLSLSTLATTLVEYGYRRVPLVEEVGEFALRGGLLDVFVPGHALPFRLEFFGDDVETIRTFDVSSQTSVATWSTALIAPMQPLSRAQRDAPEAWERVRQYLQGQGWRDTLITASVERWRHQPPGAWPWGLAPFFYHTGESPFAYLPDTGLLCCVDTEDVYLTLRQLPPPEPLHFGEDASPWPEAHLLAPCELAQQLQQRLDIALRRYDTLAETTSATVQVQGVPQFFGALERFITHVRQWQAEAWGICILCHSPHEVRRLQDLLTTYGLESLPVAADTKCLIDAMPRPGTIALGIGQLSQGFIWPEQCLVVLRTPDIFGEKRQSAPPAPRRAHQALLDFATLRAGDRVVHIDYGIGRYRRMTFLDVGRDGGEFLELEYAEGAKLYIPSYRLDMVQKYTGGGEHDDGHLDRLGGTSWARTKERVKTALLEMAEELIELHAVRQQDTGYGFSPNGTLHQDFDNSFDYVETEDQLRAIQDVIVDMERPRPMERLVCGDVGYGKTEVAMRAAFKAAYDGKQVAVLVPTTVLAQQHYDTFQRRFAPYPLRLAMLSRLSSSREQHQVLAGLQQGTIDIVIGTHRLLQKDVSFKDLGLLVVDEEHRFGVRHKEQIKRLTQHIDVLMLTATPIPRSLHMALVGLRDCSIIATPPEGRSAIKTMVTPFSDEVIQRAIWQELERDGQVFFVHNRIETLPAMQAFLERLVPACRVGIAHGQMPPRTLERLMLRFLHREFDLLLCTTIIESGLDIPSVNTIIINHAETFGLAQLYQLRGRVGRSTQQAYAYLLIPGDLILSDVARQRIEAIEEFSELGSGFHLASRDLEIRGAGNLLGSRQSGHIASVGFDLYSQMLAEAIRTVRGEEIAVRVEPELRLAVQGYFPDVYIDSDAQRLTLYRRLSAVTAPTELASLQQEVQDRFGPLPEVAQRLFAVVEIKLLTRQLAIERLEQRGTDVLLTFHPRTSIEPAQLLRWLQATTPGFRFHSERVVSIPCPNGTPEGFLARLKERLQQLGEGSRISC